MKEKLVSFFFNSISLIVWAVTIVVVFTALFMLCTGMKQPPVFTLSRAAIETASPETLAENGREGDDWYAVSLTVRVSASDRSPFTYTAEGIEVGAVADMPEGAFLVADPPEISFSKAQPQDITLRYYVQYPEGAGALARAAEGLVFRFTGYTGHFVFLKIPIRRDQPGFTVSQFEDLPIELPAEEETVTLGEAAP